MIKVFNFNFKTKLELFVFSLGISFIFLMFGIFIFSLLGLLYSLVVFCFILLMLLISWREFKNIVLELKNLKIKLDFSSAFSAIKNILFIVIFILLIFDFVGIIKPHPSSVDGLSTYFNVPDLLVKYYEYKPMMHHSMANMGQNTEMVYASIISLVGTKYMVHFQFLSFVLVILTFYLFLRRVFGDKYATLAVFSLYFIPWNKYYASTAKVEFFLCFYSILMIYSAYLWKSEKKAEFLYLTGIFSGIAIGIKYNALFLILPLYTVIFFFILSSKNKIKEIKIFLLSIFLAILFFSPWAIKNQIYFDNAFFPFKTLIGEADTGIGGLSFDTDFKEERSREIDNLRHSVSENKFNPINIVETLWNQSVGRNIDTGFWLNFGFIPILIVPFYFIYLFQRKLTLRDKNFAVFLLLSIAYMVVWYIAAGARSWYGLFGIMMLYACIPYLFLKNRLFFIFYVFYTMTIFLGTYLIEPENLDYLSGKTDSKEYFEETFYYSDSAEFINSLNLKDEKILMTGQYESYGINRNDEILILDAYYLRASYNMYLGHEYFYEQLKKSNINYISRKIELEEQIIKSMTSIIGVDTDTYLSEYKGDIPSFIESVIDLENFVNNYAIEIWRDEDGQKRIYKLK